MWFRWLNVLPVFLFSACTPPIEKQQLPVTWNEVAPIVFKNCAPCHRPGEAGGFDLLNYADAVKKANLMRFVTRTRYMPPWPADHNYSHFVGEWVLTEAEIKLIGDWVAGGTLKGDSTKAPATPTFYAGSYFGEPDLVIRPQKPIPITGNGTDAFMIIKYPYQINKDTIIDFVEFVPDHRKLIHHVNGHLVNYDERRQFDQFAGVSMVTDTRKDLVQVYATMGVPYLDKAQPSFPALTPNTVYYLPGFIPPAYPTEVGGYKMKKNGIFLLNNIHYGPSNADGLDSSYINVFYRKTPIRRPISETQLGTFGISTIEPEFVIPPNEVKTFHTQSTLSKPISMLSVNPHMHLVGTSFWAFALAPDGDTIPLIRIPKWDFRWQYYYTFKHPVKLDAGTTIHVYGTYDNTTGNVNNPFHPPQTITQGNGVESMRTTEEMFQFIFTYMPYAIGDELIDLERK